MKIFFLLNSNFVNTWGYDHQTLKLTLTSQLTPLNTIIRVNIKYF